LIIHKNRGKIQHHGGRDFMETGSVLHILMGERMNGILNEIAKTDTEYPEISRKSGIYSDRLETLHLPKETRLLIDRYISEQNALGSRYGRLAYLLGFSDCRELILGKMPFTEMKETVQKSGT